MNVYSGSSIASLARSVRISRHKSVLRNLTFCLTERCNSKCLMCDFWMIHNGKDLSFDKIKEILEDRSLKELTNINLTGGEPFLRHDLHYIANMIAELYPFAGVSVSSNFLNRYDVVAFLKRTHLDNLTFYTSLDGARNHDRIRGIRHSFQRTKKTIISLKKQNPHVKITSKFTITPWNFDEILDTYRLTQELNTGFQLKIIENVRNYTNPISFKNNKKEFLFSNNQVKNIVVQLGTIKKSLLEKGSIYEYIYINGIIQNLLKKSRKSNHCVCIWNSLFILPNGDAFICRKGEKSGNVFSSSVTDILESKNSIKVMKRFTSGLCLNCASIPRYYG